MLINLFTHIKGKVVWFCQSVSSGMLRAICVRVAGDYILRVWLRRCRSVACILPPSVKVRYGLATACLPLLAC